VAELPLRILQVSSSDIGGGAERVAWNLFDQYRTRGYQSHLAVGYKRSADPDILLIPNDQKRTGWARWWTKQQPLGLARKLAEPIRTLDQLAGLEDFNFPGTRELLELTPQVPTIVHAHNLHGDYFDLRFLPALSRKVPVVLSLHDAWLLSGHCAHSFDCERWLTGCGQCPDLTIYPALRRDGTARNWKRKKRIFAESTVYLSTACQWLMDKVEASMLMPAVRQQRIIPYGVDISIFARRNKEGARAQLGLPANAHVILFTANRIRKNIWKDYDTMRAAISKVETVVNDKPVIFVALGEDAPTEQMGSTQMRFFPFRTELSEIAAFYQAADIYLHGARIDTFPNAVLEALACGTPVVASAVGGIPEQIADGTTGFLVPSGDAQAMANRIVQLLKDDVNKRMSNEAAADARKRFSLERHVKDHLSWYREILDDFHSKDRSTGNTPITRNQNA
jgi:glycosyltransferase involved in cell wall biosynthesis